MNNMIRFNFALSNPFSDRWNFLLGKSGKSSQHKAWEFNLYETHNIIEVDLRFTVKGDHSGLHIMIGLLGYAVEYDYYDIRHWDYGNNTWKVYNDQI